MTVEEDRMRLRSRLEELVGMSGADILMDRPAGGWSDLVTNHTLDLRFAASEERFDRKLEALEHRMDLRFAELERTMDLRFAAIDHRFDRFEHELLAQVDRRLRAQTWMMMSTIIATVGILIALIRV
jgi:hypothetical protein